MSPFDADGTTATHKCKVIELWEGSSLGLVFCNCVLIVSITFLYAIDTRLFYTYVLLSCCLKSVVNWC